MLPGGEVLVHPVSPATNRATIIYNAVSNNWLPAGQTLRSQDEASWVKLPDGSILTVDADTTASERYIPSLNQWIVDANLPVSLWASLAPKFTGETVSRLCPTGKFHSMPIATHAPRTPIFAFLMEAFAWKIGRPLSLSMQV